MDPDQVGLLIVRVWVEPGSVRPARLQIRATTDLSAGFACTRTLTDVGEAITVIRTFLNSVLSGDTARDRPAPGAAPPRHGGLPPGSA
jgi:hypothetical protein